MCLFIPSNFLACREVEKDWSVHNVNLIFLGKKRSEQDDISGNTIGVRCTHTW